MSLTERARLPRRAGSGALRRASRPAPPTAAHCARRPSAPCHRAPSTSTATALRTLPPRPTVPATATSIHSGPSAATGSPARVPARPPSAQCPTGPAPSRWPPPRSACTGAVPSASRASRACRLGNGTDGPAAPRPPGSLRGRRAPAVAARQPVAHDDLAPLRSRSGPAARALPRAHVLNRWARALPELDVACDSIDNNCALLVFQGRSEHSRESEAAKPRSLELSGRRAGTTPMLRSLGEPLLTRAAPPTQESHRPPRCRGRGIPLEPPHAGLTRSASKGSTSAGANSPRLVKRQPLVPYRAD